MEIESPPLPTKMPNIPPPPKLAVSDEPITQETKITQTAYRGRRENGNGSDSGSDMTNVSKRGLSCITRLNQIYSEGESGYVVRVNRKAPKNQQNIRAWTEGIRFDDLRDTIRQDFGEGTYEVIIFDENNKIVRPGGVAVFAVLKEEGGKAKYGGSEMVRVDDELETDQIVAARTELTLEKMKSEALAAKLRTEDITAEAARKKRQRELDEEDDKIKRELDREERRERVSGQQAFMQKLIERMDKVEERRANEKPGPSITEIVTAISQALAPVIQPLMQRLVNPPVVPKTDNEYKEILKEVIMPIVAAKVNQQENQIDLWRAARSEAREEMKELLDTQNVDIDPDNVGKSLFKYGAEGLVKHGGQIAAGVLEWLNRAKAAAPPTQMSAEQIAASAVQALPNSSPEALPPPLEFGAPAPQKPPPTPEPTLRLEDTNPPRSSDQSGASGVGELNKTEEQMTLQERADVDLREWVTKTMEEACLDVHFERNAPDWIEMAFEKWGWPLLKELAEIEPQKAAERIELLTNPEVWSQLKELFVQGNKGYVFLCQVSLFQQLVKKALEARKAADATPKPA
jgi:hypothetical protein